MTHDRTMANDDSDFEKLLKEAREWDARDRARHQSLMKDDSGADSFAIPSRAPTVTIDELEKKAAVDLNAGRQRPMMETPKPAASIKVALKTAVKQAKAQQTMERAKPKGSGFGWIIWALIIGYFVFKRFLH